MERNNKNDGRNRIIEGGEKHTQTNTWQGEWGCVPLPA